MKKLYLTFADLTCLAGFAVPGNQKFLYRQYGFWRLLWENLGNFEKI